MLLLMRALAVGATLSGRAPTSSPQVAGGEHRSLAETTVGTGGDVVDGGPACHNSSEVAMLALDAAIAVQQAHALLLAGLQTKAERSNVTALAHDMHELSLSLQLLSSSIGRKADSDAVNTLSDAVNEKASAAEVVAQLDQKADHADVNALAAEVNEKAAKADTTADLRLKANQSDFDELAADVATKAEQSVLDTLSAVVNEKAAKADTTAALRLKANQSDFDALSTAVATKAEQSDLSSLASTIDDKAAASELAAVLVDMQALRHEVVELRAALATLSLASCGDANGPGGSVQPVTNADCGRGYIANPLASEARCAGPACDLENVAEDKVACCVAQATCRDADGEENATSALSDADCGTGYIYDPDSAGSLCVGTICDPGSVEADKAACCTALATCGDRDGEEPGITSVSDGDCGAGLIYNASAAAMFCEGPVCNITNGTADHSTCCGPYSDVPGCLSDVGDGPGSCMIYLRADARGLGVVAVDGGQSFEVHGGGHSLLEVEADWEVESTASLALAGLRLLGGSGGAAVIQSGGDVTLLRVEISSGTVSFSGALTVTDCALTSTQLISSTASSLLRISGGTLTGSEVSLSGGSVTIEGSSVLVDSPVSITAGILSLSQCELQSDGTFVPLTIESGGSAMVTSVVFRSSSGDDITVVSVSDGGSLTVGESQLVGADGSADPFPCDGTLPICVGPHAGPVTVDGPASIMLTSPLVCNMATGRCSSMPARLLAAGVTSEQFAVGIAAGVALNAAAVCFSQQYAVLDDAWRRITEPVGSHCDRDAGGIHPNCYEYAAMQRQWFRISGVAGDAIPTSPPSARSCGFAKPGWLSGWSASQGCAYEHNMLLVDGVTLSTPYRGQFGCKTDGSVDSSSAYFTRTYSVPSMYSSTGSYPTTAEGIVQGTVCFVHSVSTRSGIRDAACNDHATIGMVNCGDFMLWRLPDAPDCGTGQCDSVHDNYSQDYIDPTSASGMGYCVTNTSAGNHTMVHSWCDVNARTCGPHGQCVDEAGARSWCRCLEYTGARVVQTGSTWWGKACEHEPLECCSRWVITHGNPCGTCCGYDCGCDGTCCVPSCAHSYDYPEENLPNGWPVCDISC